MFAGAQGTMLPCASLHRIVTLEWPYKEGEDAFEATAAVQINYSRRVSTETANAQCLFDIPHSAQ